MLKYTSRHKQLASVLFLFFQLVSILSLLISSSFISSLVLIPSSVTILCTISAVQPNINCKSTSVSSVFLCVWVCVVYVAVCICERTVFGESICKGVLFIRRQNFNNCNYVLRQTQTSQSNSLLSGL